MFFAASQVVSGLAVFVLLFIQTKFLSPDIFGTLSYLIIASEFVKFFGSQWLSSFYLRFSNNNAFEEQILRVSVLRSVFTLSFLFALLFTVVIIAFGIMSKDLCFEFFFFAFSKAIFIFSLEFFRSNFDGYSYLKATLLNFLLSVLCSLALLFFAANLSNALLALVIANILCILGFYKSMFTSFGVNIDRSDFVNIARSSSKFGFPLVLSYILSFSAPRIDRLFIENMISLEQLGIYSAYFSIVFGVSTLLFSMVALPIYPRLKLYFDNGSSKFGKMRDTYFEILIFFTGSGSLFIFYTANIWGGYLYTFTQSNFIDTVGYLVLASFFLGLKQHFADHALLFTGNTKYIFYTTFLHFCSGLLLVLLIKPSNLLGFSQITAFSSFLSLILSLVVGNFYNVSVRFSFGLLNVFMFIVCFSTSLNFLFLNTSYELGLIFLAASLIVFITFMKRVYIQTKVLFGRAVA